MVSAPLYLGIDMGTSGGRAMVIDGEFFFPFISMMPPSTSSSTHSRTLLLRPTHAPSFLSRLLPSPSDSGTVVASAKKAYPPLPPDATAPRDWAETWASALDDLLESLSESSLPPSSGAAGSVLPRVASAAVAGTSASMLLVNAGREDQDDGEGGGNGGTPATAVGAPLAPVRLYCDAASPAAVAATAALAPPGHQAAAPTSALSKLMDWWASGAIEERDHKERGAAAGVVPVVISAADWLTARLGRVGPPKKKKEEEEEESSADAAAPPSSSSSSSRSSDGQFLRSRLFVTDDNNQLKAGWDPGAREYEPWLRDHPAAARLAPRVLRPGDELLAVAGKPYDTMDPVIGIGEKGVEEEDDDGEIDNDDDEKRRRHRSSSSSSSSSSSASSSLGSLKDWGVSFRALPLDPATSSIDWAALATAVRPETRVALVQRSCGYSSERDTLTLAEIARAASILREAAAEVGNDRLVVAVDNCYGEFTEGAEPGSLAGVDLVMGSFIKGLGGTVAPCGGYVCGRRELVEAAAARATAPGVGLDYGAIEGSTLRLLFQGLWLVSFVFFCCCCPFCFFFARGRERSRRFRQKPHFFLF